MAKVERKTVGLIGRKVGMTQIFSERGELVPVTVTLRGSFDGQPLVKTAAVAVGGAWKEFRLDCDVPAAVSAGLTAEFAVPAAAGGPVLLDALSFRPGP